MIFKWIGAVFVFSACGTTGFFIAAEHRREMRNIRGLMSALEWMSWELSYHLTPLPELCKKAASACSGDTRRILFGLVCELEQQLCSDIISAMSLTIQKQKGISGRYRHLLETLGASLGRFDLSGQLAGISSVQELCRQELLKLEHNREQRLRSYQTLGFCAGAALVIIFI